MSDETNEAVVLWLHQDGTFNNGPGILASARKFMCIPDASYQALLASRDAAEAALASFTKIHAEGDKIDATMAGEAVRVFSIALAETFRNSGALNYIEMMANSPDGADRFTVTVQRAGGKTPHELRRAAEARVEELTKVIVGLLSFTDPLGMSDMDINVAARTALSRANAGGAS